MPPAPRGTNLAQVAALSERRCPREAKIALGDTRPVVGLGGVKIGRKNARRRNLQCGFAPKRSAAMRGRLVGGAEPPTPHRQNFFETLVDSCSQTQKSVLVRCARLHSQDAGGQRKQPDDPSEASERSRGSRRRVPGQEIVAVAVPGQVVSPAATPTPTPPSRHQVPSAAARLVGSTTQGEKGTERSRGCPRVVR